MMKSIVEIDLELADLGPAKEIAYADYSENTGAEKELRDRLWDRFDTLRNRFNDLLDTKDKLLGLNNNAPN